MAFHLPKVIEQSKELWMFIWNTTRAEEENKQMKWRRWFFISSRPVAVDGDTTTWAGFCILEYRVLKFGEGGNEKIEYRLPGSTQSATLKGHDLSFWATLLPFYDF